jgi:epoxyqueuosine reductase
MATEIQRPLDREAVRAHALEIGFDVVRFTRAETAEHVKHDLAEFLTGGLHGDMAWLKDNAVRRADPRVLWPNVKTAIMVGLNYGPPADPRNILSCNDQGAISVYAQNRDYHDVLKKRLKRFAAWLAETTGAEVKVFVDTAPVLEKPLAQQAGLGWQGKHTNLVSRAFGSWLFLGEVFTTFEFASDVPEADHCGACSRCLDVCPTNAFVGPYKLDARKCISYLTIEHKGPIPRDLRSLMGNRIYGCDDCLAVCPWNKFACVTDEAGFIPRAELSAPVLKDLAALDEATFRKIFAGSPIKRIGRGRFIRNVLIAIGNSADQYLLPTAASHLDDDSPLVRGAAVWAVRRLAATDRAAELRDAHLPAETDADVQKEWAAEI